MKHLKLFNEYHLTESEHIDLKDIDFQKEFDYLNNLMFDNKIKPIPLKWFKSKSKLGLLSHIHTEVTKLEISNFYHLTRKQFMETLAHEMIHAYMVQNGIFEKTAHGPKFFRIMNDLNRRFPQYNIKKSEDASEFSVKSDKLKYVGSVLFKCDAEYMVVFVSLEVIENQENIDIFVDELKRYISKNPLNVFYKNKTVDIEFYKCSSPNLLSFKIKRSLSLKNLALSSVNDRTLSEILEGEKITSVKIK